MKPKIISTELFNACKEEFQTFYTKFKGNPFYYDAKQLGQLSNIIKRLKGIKDAQVIKGVIESYTDEDIQKNFKYILWNMPDSGFVWDNLSPAIITNQWNQILVSVQEKHRKNVVKVENKRKFDEIPRSFNTESIQEILKGLKVAGKNVL